MRTLIVTGGLSALFALALVGCGPKPPANTDANTATCGNGTLDPAEECEGGNLNAQTCTSLGFGGGTLTCTTACAFDTSGCTAEPLPDLMVLETAFTIDMAVLDPYNLRPDEVALGCGPNGTTNRRVLEFTLVSENVGTAELHFGSPAAILPPYTGLWVLNAAGYRAFHDYATYWLCAGTDLTACASPTAAHAADGFKESFCFIENFGVAPDYTGTPASPPCNTVYDCGDMGQRPGCADDYYPGLDCQWIDITGLAAGPYVMCAHIDPTDVIVELDDSNNIGCLAVTIP